MSTKTIRRRIADGTITGYRFGPRLLRVDLDEIDSRLLQPIPRCAEGGELMGYIEPTEAEQAARGRGAAAEG